jgi:hypothetical protein
VPLRGWAYAALAIIASLSSIALRASGDSPDISQPCPHHPSLARFAMPVPGSACTAESVAQRTCWFWISPGSPARRRPSGPLADLASPPILVCPAHKSPSLAFPVAPLSQCRSFNPRQSSRPPRPDGCGGRHPPNHRLHSTALHSATHKPHATLHYATFRSDSVQRETAAFGGYQPDHCHHRFALALTAGPPPHRPGPALHAGGRRQGTMSPFHPPKPYRAKEGASSTRFVPWLA